MTLVPKLGLLCHFLSIHFQTAITLVLNAKFQKFKSPAQSAWYALAPEKEFRSIGPLGPELWLCAKMVTVSQFISNFQMLKRSLLLEWCFSKIQKPSHISLVCTSPRHKTQNNCSPRIQVMVVQRGYLSKDLWSVHVQMLITQAWNGVSWKFKNLKLTVWSALHKGAGLAAVAPDSGLQIVSTINSALIHYTASLAEAENNKNLSLQKPCHIFFQVKSLFINSFCMY